MQVLANLMQEYTGYDACDPESATAVTDCPSTLTSRYEVGQASKSASSLGIEATVVPESLSPQQLQQLLAEQRLDEGKFLAK